MSSLSDHISDSAINGSKRIAGDELTVEEHSLQDLIAADEYLEMKTAAASGNNPFRIIRTRAPSAID